MLIAARWRLRSVLVITSYVPRTAKKKCSAVTIRQRADFSPAPYRDSTSNSRPDSYRRVAGSTRSSRATQRSSAGFHCTPLARGQTRRLGPRTAASSSTSRCAMSEASEPGSCAMSEASEPGSCAMSEASEPGSCARRRSLTSASAVPSCVCSAAMTPSTRGLMIFAGIGRSPAGPPTTSSSPNGADGSVRLTVRIVVVRVPDRSGFGCLGQTAASAMPDHSAKVVPRRQQAKP